MAPSRPPSGFSGTARWGVVLLLAALAVGIAAALLVAPTPPPPPDTNPSATVVPEWVVGIGALALIGVLFGVYLVSLARSHNRLRIGGRALPGILAVFGISIAFLLLARFAAPGAPTSPVNETAPPPTGGAGTAANNSTLPIGLGPVTLGGSTIPGLLVVAVLAVAAIVLVVGVGVVTRLRHRAEDEDDRAGAAAARSALASALHELGTPGDGDARATIVALYARLLARLAPTGLALDAMSPREIARYCTERLGIAPSTAQELTDLFEEARYSTHPLDAPVAERAKVVVAAALADVDRAQGAG